jgi:hypothetical protein
MAAKKSLKKFLTEKTSATHQWSTTLEGGDTIKLFFFFADKIS